MFSTLHCQFTRVLYALRGGTIPLLVPSLELDEREELGSFYSRLPASAPTFLGKPITIAFHTGDRTFFVGNEMVMLTRPVPIRHLRWLRVLLPRLADTIPTIISELQQDEPEFADTATMQAELRQPVISFSSENRYGEWSFNIEQPSRGETYGFTVLFSQFRITDSFSGD